MEHSQMSNKDDKDKHSNVARQTLFSLSTLQHLNGVSETHRKRSVFQNTPVSVDKTLVLMLS